MRAVWPWKTLKSLCDQQTHIHISGTSRASDGGGITSQLGAVAVSLAKTRGFCVCRGSFPLTLHSSLLANGLALMFQSRS